MELELIWLSNGTAVHKGLNSVTIILPKKQKNIIETIAPSHLRTGRIVLESFYL